jgi:transcriptional regulator GlxA family with amidase domain
MIRIAVPALPGCVASSVTGVLDVFAAANRVGRDMGRDPGFAAEIVAMRPGAVASFHDLSVEPQRVVDPDADYDLVVVAAVYGNLEGLLAEREAAAWLAAQHRRGACVCGVCAGVFLLAEAGLLDGREATTHWALAERFRGLYPRVRLTPELLLVDLGDVVTGGGVTAYLDLCMHLTARFGSPELAALCAKIFLVDAGRRSQAPYAAYAAPRGHGDEAILRAQDWLEENLSRPVSLDDTAKAARLGTRTLLRRFRKATGDTPRDYATRLRIETAKRLLETTARTVEELSESTGYADPGAFRRAFKARTGLTPGEYRNRFSVL